MQKLSNVSTILKKELRSYFSQPTAYILLVVFLAISYFFYFRPVLISGESSLRPLFNILPWILMFLVPAITMGLLAREKDNGTIELLSTQPITNLDILIGKTLGAFIFIAIAILITLTIPLTLASYGDFDWGIIISQYIGTMFLAASLSAIGVWVSSITKNQIVAFVLGVAINFILIFVGFEMVLLSLPNPFDLILKNLSIFDHFYNIARGVIDLRDVIYFILLILIFEFLAYISLIKNKGGNANKKYKKLSNIIVIIVIVALGVNLSGGYIRGRIDITSGKIYTLSKSTKKILSEMEDEVTIELFVNKKMPAQISASVQDARDSLNDYKKNGGDKINLKIYYPDEDSEAEKLAASRGIPTVQFNVIAKDEFQTKKGYFGLVAYSGVGEDKKQEIIPFIEQPGALEYKLSSFIYNSSNEQKKKISFLSGHGELDLYQEMSYLNSEMSAQYEMEPLILTETEASPNSNEQNVSYKDVPEDVAALVIAGPSQPISEAELGKINAYIETGGSVMVFARMVESNPQFLTATTTDSNINLMLNEWGVEVNKNIVYDLQSNETVTLQGGAINYIIPYPFWVKALKNNENPAVGDINSIVIPWGSSIEILENKLKPDTEINPIFTTTEFSRDQENIFNLDPNQNWLQDDLDSYIMAVSIQNYFEGKNSRVIVAGNSLFATQDFAMKSSSNMVFVQNAIEWLAQDDILSSIRTKKLSRAPLIFESEAQKNSVKYFNMIGVPILIAIIGVIVMWLRKRRMKKKFLLT